MPPFSTFIWSEPTLICLYKRCNRFSTRHDYWTLLDYRRLFELTVFFHFNYIHGNEMVIHVKIAFAMCVKALINPFNLKSNFQLKNIEIVFTNMRESYNPV